MYNIEQRAANNTMQYIGKAQCMYYTDDGSRMSHRFHIIAGIVIH